MVVLDGARWLPGAIALENARQAAPVQLWKPCRRDSAMLLWSRPHPPSHKPNHWLSWRCPAQGRPRQDASLPREAALSICLCVVFAFGDFPSFACSLFEVPLSASQMRGAGICAVVSTYRHPHPHTWCHDAINNDYATYSSQPRSLGPDLPEPHRHHHSFLVACARRWVHSDYLRHAELQVARCMCAGRCLDERALNSPRLKLPPKS
jgi:hypothetical protein